MKTKVTNFVLTSIQAVAQKLKRTNEGGRTIRYARLKKFRKKSKKLIFVLEIAAIWYLLILTGSYLTSDTGAYFNDIEVIENSLHVKWDVPEPEYPPDDGIWENSSLEEVSISGNCVEGIYARFTNTGNSVDHELTKFKVFWSAAGNPRNGEVVKEGFFPIPNKDEFFDIHYVPDKNGKYTIKAYHETGHSNGNGNGTGPWSGEITITGCNNP